MEEEVIEVKKWPVSIRVHNQLLNAAKSLKDKVAKWDERDTDEDFPYVAVHFLAGKNKKGVTTRLFRMQGSDHGCLFSAHISQRAVINSYLACTKAKMTPSAAVRVCFGPDDDQWYGVNHTRNFPFVSIDADGDQNPVVQYQNKETNEFDNMEYSVKK